MKWPSRLTSSCCRYYYRISVKCFCQRARRLLMRSFFQQMTSFVGLWPWVASWQDYQPERPSSALSVFWIVLRGRLAAWPSLENLPFTGDGGGREHCRYQWFEHRWKAYASEDVQEKTATIRIVRRGALFNRQAELQTSDIWAFRTQQQTKQRS